MATGLLTAVSAQFATSAGSTAVIFFLSASIALAIATLLFFAAKRVKSVHASAQPEDDKVDQLQRQSLRYDVALNNMSQGLLMFDSFERAVLFNRRYLEISKLPAEFMQSGRTLREILYARREKGTFAGNVEEYRAELLGHIARGETKSLIIESIDGRSSRVLNAPMADGGWIATHEDITEQILAERVIENQKLHLDAAISNMPQGLCMFDHEQRLIICNKQYADIYGLSDELTKPGTPLRRILKHWAATGVNSEDKDAYIEKRIERTRKSEPYQMINHLPDGRYISVVHRPMADGGWVSTHEDVTAAKLREKSFRLLFDNSPLPMWVIDRKSLKFLAVNEAVIARYGYSREQFMSMTVPELMPTHDRERFAAHVRALPDDQLDGRTGKHWLSDGRSIDVEVFSRALIYDGRPARLTVIHDITKTKLATDELNQTKKFLDAVIEHVPVPIVVRDVAGLGDDVRNARFHLFNRAYEDITGDSRAGLIGKTPDEIYPPERADLIVKADNEALHSGGVIDIPEHGIPTVAKGMRLVTGKKTVIKNDDGEPQYLLTVLDDVTDRRRADERIAYLAHNDSLTDLPNRATCVEYLDATLAQAAKNGDRFAILCVDLDRFKEANDVYGHLVGDGLLREAARRLHAAAGGQFLARVGGDEFTLIVTNCSQPEGAVTLSKRLLAAFKHTFEVDGQRLQLGLSIGGAIYPDDGKDAKTLIANADAALYQAKAEARGSLCLFDAKLAARLHERRDLQKDLQGAIVRNELFLHYQPQAKIGNGKITGFEALVRWQHPKRGLIAPGHFIPLAEESGFIVQMGTWILREACREAASWPLPLTIAVNISPIQFQAGDLANQIHLILLETGLAPGRLELEITEGVLIDDFRRAVSILRKIKALGVQIAMDDFGSGYSSLSYLHSFAFDKIKIDRSFIGDLESNHHSMAIVRAIITLGHSLNVPVLAEGVETEAQRQFLTQEGCDAVQGFLIGRPLPIATYAGVIGDDERARRNLGAAAQRHERA